MRALAELFRLLLGSVATRGRLILLILLGVVPLAVGFLLGANSDEPTRAWAPFASNYGLTLLAGVGSLVVASATLGAPSEDGTLVYLWLRPIARWRLAVAAYGAALTVMIPLVTIALGVGAALARTPARTVSASISSGILAIAAYSAGFTWLGLRVKRPLAWGLGYILIWEGFVARAGHGAARLAVAAYTRTVLARASGVSLRLADQAAWASVAVPLAVAAVGLWLTARRLARADVA